MYSSVLYSLTLLFGFIKGIFEIYKQLVKVIFLELICILFLFWFKECGLSNVHMNVRIVNGIIATVITKSF
jgi:hypothetical protein